MEVILVEDCSADGTLAHIRRLKQKYPPGWIQIIQLRNNVGPGQARNIGWDIANQPYIAFLDADDTWHPEKLNIQYHWMMRRPDVMLTGHGYKPMDHRDRSSSLPADWTAKRVSPRLFLLKNQFSTPSAMLRRPIAYRFDDGKGHSEDYLLWLVIALRGHPVWYLDLPLAYVGKAIYGEAGQTKSLWQMEIGELNTYMQLHKNGFILFVSLYFLSMYSIVKFFRRSLILSARRSFR